MRDTNENMIELLETLTKDNLYFALIRHTIANEELKLLFGIQQSDYVLLKKLWSLDRMKILA